MDFYVDNCDFGFYCQPYLLKLNLPLPCVEDENCKAEYDVNLDNGTIFVYLPKEIKNTEYPDLDLLTKLLPTKVSDIFPKKPTK